MKKKVLLSASLLALIWNFYMQIQAAFNIPSALTQDSRGIFHSQPFALRITFLIQALVLAYQFFFLIQLYLRGGTWSKNSHLLARIFLFLSAFFALVNAFSANSELRLHGIAAAIIAYAFYEIADLNFQPRK